MGRQPDHGRYYDVVPVPPDYRSPQPDHRQDRHHGHSQADYPPISGALSLNDDIAWAKKLEAADGVGVTVPDETDNAGSGVIVNCKAVMVSPGITVRGLLRTAGAFD